MVELGCQARFQPVGEGQAARQSPADENQCMRPEIPVQGIGLRVIDEAVEPHPQAEDEIKGQPLALQEGTLRKPVQVHEVAQPRNPVVMQGGDPLPAQADPEIRIPVQGSVRTVFLRCLVPEGDASGRIDIGGHHLIPPGEGGGHITRPALQGVIPGGRRRLLCLQAGGYQQHKQQRNHFSCPSSHLNSPCQSEGTAKIRKRMVPEGAPPRFVRAMRRSASRPAGGSRRSR